MTGSPLALRTVRATKYVTAFREGGSLPGLVEADDDGLYVVKFRGAAQGPRALVAEVIAGELARALSLPVPELVLVEVDPSLGGLDGDPWVGELLKQSPGLWTRSAARPPHCWTGHCPLLPTGPRRRSGSAPLG